MANRSPQAIGRRNRDKGREGENEFAAIIGGERTSESGSSRTDVVGLGLRWECKRRRNEAFKQLYGWLDGKDAVAVRADRKPWLVVLTVDRLLELMGGKQGG